MPSFGQTLLWIAAQRLCAPLQLQSNVEPSKTNHGLRKRNTLSNPRVNLTVNMSTLTRHPRNSSRQALIDNEQYTQNVRGLRPAAGDALVVDGDLLVNGSIIGVVPVASASLADTLIVGNTTGANDIVLSGATGVATTNGRLEQLGTVVRLVTTQDMLLQSANTLTVQSSAGSVTLSALTGNVDVTTQNYTVLGTQDHVYVGRDLTQTFSRDVTISGGGGNSITLDSVGQNVLIAAGDEIDLTAGGQVRINADSVSAVTTNAFSVLANVATVQGNGNANLVAGNTAGVVGQAVNVTAFNNVVVSSDAGTATLRALNGTTVGRDTALTSVLGNGVTINALPGSGQLIGFDLTLTANNNITLNAPTGTVTINAPNVDIATATGTITQSAPTGDIVQDATNFIFTATNLAQLVAGSDVSIASTGASANVLGNTVAQVSAPVVGLIAATSISQQSPIVNIGTVADSSVTNIRGVNLDVNVSGNIDLVAPNFDVVADISSFEGSELEMNVDRFQTVAPAMPTVSGFGSLTTGSTNIAGRWRNILGGERLTFNPPLPVDVEPIVMLSRDSPNNNIDRFLRFSTYAVDNTGFTIAFAYGQFDEVQGEVDLVSEKIDLNYFVICIQK